MNYTDEQLQKMQADNSREWLEATVDTISLSQSDREYVESLRGPKKVMNDFDLMDRSYEKSKITADDFTDSDLAELARRDPNGFGKQYNEAKMDEVIAAFKKANLSYLPVQANFDTIMGHIKTHQLHDPDLDDDDVISEAYKAGYWTLENLSGTFKVLARQGLMKMKPNQAKPLTREEQLAVISAIRSNDLQGAVIAYIQLSYGGTFPEGYRTVRDFLVANQDLAARATWFIFEHAHSDIAPADFKAFKKANAHICLPTFEALEIAFLSWSQRPTQTPQTQPQSAPEPTPVDLNKLTDAELDKVIAEERQNYRKTR